MPFSARKMHFFDKNGNLTPRLARTSANVKELFFREVILHQFLKRKNWALLSKNVQAILTLLNLAQKVPFLSKKCIFRTENGIFLKSSFYKKMFSDPKYSFPVCQKYFFSVSKKVGIFHRIQPKYVSSTYLFIQIISISYLYASFDIRELRVWSNTDNNILVTRTRECPKHKNPRWQQFFHLKIL